MKKNKYGKSFFISVSALMCSLSLLSLAGCNSTKVVSDDLLADAVMNSDSSAAVASNKTAEEPSAVSVKTEVQEVSANWVYIPKKTFTAAGTDASVFVRESTGSFSIRAVNDDGNSIDLLSSADAFCSSYFAVKIGKKMYCLNSESGIKSEARKTAGGAQLSYTVPDQAQVVIDFSFVPSNPYSGRTDVIKVTAYVINIGKKSQNFAVKAVFDTVLGENSFAHFTTASAGIINSEHQFLDLKDDVYICSENEKASAQFLLYGKGITQPLSVTVANKDVFSNSSWNHTVQEGRSFNSLMAYNNSALEIVWKDQTINPLSSSSATFYISVATKGKENPGQKFLAGLSKSDSGRTRVVAASPVTPAAVPAAKTTVPVTASSGTVTVNAVTAAPVTTTGTAEITLPAASTAKAAEVSSHDDGVVVQTSNLFDESQSGGKPKASAVSKTDENPVSKTDSLDQISDSASKSTAETTYNPAASTSTSKESKITDKQLDPAYIQSILDQIAALEANPDSADEEEIARLNRELDEILQKLNSGADE